MKKILKLILIPVILGYAAFAQSPYYGIKINTQSDIAEGHISGKWQIADDPATPDNYTIILDGTNGSITADGNLTIDNNTLYVDSTSDRTGMGTLTPSEILHIKDGNIKIEGTSGTHGLIFPDGTKQTTKASDTPPAGNTGEVQFNNNGNFQADSNFFWDNTNKVLQVPAIRGGSSSGDNLILQSTSDAAKGKILLGNNSAFDEVNARLGIGTTSPGRTLHIQGTTNVNARWENTTGNVIFTLTAGNTLGFIGTQTNHDLRLLVNDLPVGVFSTNGYFGVGTTAPDESLHIKDGNIKIEGTSGTHGLIFPDGTKQTTASSGGGTASVPRGYIDGFIMEQDASDTAHDIKVNAGLARDSSNTLDINLYSALVKQIDANWTQGTNQGGFPSGLTLSANTWYHFFVIAKSDGTVDAGFDTSLTAVNLLSDATGFTKYRRLGSVLTDASSNIKPFKQKGDHFFIDKVLDSTSITTTMSPVTVTTPNGVVCRGLFHIELSSSGYSDISIADGYSGLSNDFVVAASGPTKADKPYFELMTNTNSQIYHKYAATIPTSYNLSTIGWIDFRGKQ